MPRDVIGLCLGADGMPQMDRGEEVAIRRMLQRGPAYRARSWAWPSDGGGGAAGRGGGDTAAAAAAAVLPSPPAVTLPPVISSVRVFQPKASSKLFARLVGR